MIPTQIKQNILQEPHQFWTLLAYISSGKNTKHFYWLGLILIDILPGPHSMIAMVVGS